MTDTVQEVAWARLTAAEIQARAQPGTVAIIPVASVEQHGPHLATGVDMWLAGEVAERTARRLKAAGTEAVVTPCVWTGLAEHHMAFGGTITLDEETFGAVVGGVARSVARHGFRRICLLNGHGGNIEAIATAATVLTRGLGVPVVGATYWLANADTFAAILEAQTNVMHACEAETSMIMHLEPGLVRQERLPEAHGPGSTRVEGQPPGLAMRRSFRDLSPSGVVGDARVATAEKGEKLLAAISTKMAEVLSNPKLWG